MESKTHKVEKMPILQNGTYDKLGKTDQTIRNT